MNPELLQWLAACNKDPLAFVLGEVLDFAELLADVRAWRLACSMQEGAT